MYLYGFTVDTRNRYEAFDFRVGCVYRRSKHARSRRSRTLRYNSLVKFRRTNRLPFYFFSPPSLSLYLSHYLSFSFISHFFSTFVRKNVNININYAFIWYRVRFISRFLDRVAQKRLTLLDEKEGTKIKRKKKKLFISVRYDLTLRWNLRTRTRIFICMYITVWMCTCVRTYVHLPI